MKSGIGLILLSAMFYAGPASGQIAMDASAGRVVQPVLRYAPEPEFSELERKQKIAGKALVALVVDGNGTPTEVHLVKSIAEGMPEKSRPAAVSMDAKAVEAVKRYRYAPGTRDGRAVPMPQTVEISFQIF